ncbi:hypothetical protein [Synechococcus sp. CBW1004]|uniref:hypothetical protein n=1 Tax=Synechococcus sp. CBW1004 TaxID=1353136 RepID=UPI0018CCCB90|nr:hypothetical protein [Synechococcus sp. CBW1004]QPN63279.1 hypothetical protein H8F25_17110 [Synechococcus sp. CBW1004]
MADDTNFTSSQGRPEGAGRGNRQSGGRDSGGFRIRLSDNEMQAARALQEAFNLRSTVAVLGFSLRTLAQLLEEGKLDEVVAQQRAQGGGRPPAPRGERSERRGERDRPAGGGGGRSARVDPFARPSRPAPAPAAEPAEDAPADTLDEGSDLAATGATEAAEVSPAEVETATADAAASEATPAS